MATGYSTNSPRSLARDSLAGGDAKEANPVLDRLHVLAKSLRQAPAGRAGLTALTQHAIPEYLLDLDRTLARSATRSPAVHMRAGSQTGLAVLHDVAP